MCEKLWTLPILESATTAPEMDFDAILQWADHHKVTWHHVAPVKPV
jgi:hypothetical protein